MGNNSTSGGSGGGGGGCSSYGGSHPGYSQGGNGYGVPSSGGSAWGSNNPPSVPNFQTPTLYNCSTTFDIPGNEAYSGTSIISGEKCTISETLKADNAMNSTMDTSVGSGGNQVSGMIMALQGDINYACTSDNLKENK